MTEIFATPDDTGELHASELHSSLGEQLGAEAGDAFMGGTRVLMRGSQYLGAKYGVDPSAAMGAADAGIAGMQVYDQAMKDQAAEPDVPIADAKTYVAQQGLSDLVKLPEQPTIRGPVFDMMLDDARDRAQYAAAVNRGPQGFLPDALGFLTQVGAGMIDPVNAAAFSIPVLGEARYGKILASAGDSILGRAAVRTGVGAAQGAVGGAALVPPDWWLHSQDGQDYTMADALKSVVLSAGMGAAAHGGFGAIGDLYSRIKGEPLEGAPPIAGTHLPEETLAPGGATGVDLDGVPGITAPANNAPADVSEAGPNVSDADVLANPDQQISEGEALPLHPADVLADLPQRAQEDVVRSAIADVIAGQPVRAGEMLQEAAKEDSRIAESLTAPLPGAVGESGTARFTTAKGSVYDVHEDGTTTRDKSFHPEHGAADQGLQPRSEATFYVTPDDAQKLGEFQTQGGPAKAVAETSDGRLGVKYLEGDDAEKFEGRTVVKPQEAPAQGLIPVETWDGGRRVHFGNEIVDVAPASKEVGLDEMKAAQTGEPKLPGASSRSTKAKGPQSLLQFLAARGGISDKDPLAEDLLQSFGGKNPTVRGYGKLIRDGGKPLDNAREAAVEAGYIHDEAEQHGGVTESSINDLLDAVDREANGEKQYPAGSEGFRSKDELEAVAEQNAAASEKQIADRSAELDRLMNEWGVTSLQKFVKRRAIDIMEGDGVDAETALERSVSEFSSEGQDVTAGRGRADWQSLSQRRDPDDDDLADASREADNAPAPPETPTKSVSAAEAAAGEADKLLNDILPTLSEDERKTFEDALANLENDKAAREQMVRDGAACLAEASVGAVA